MLLGLGENFSLKTYCEKVGDLDATSINALNFGFNGVLVKKDIQDA